MITEDKLLRILIPIAAVLVILCTVAAAILLSMNLPGIPVKPPSEENGTQPAGTEADEADTAASVKETETDSLPASVLLTETADMGLDYQNRLYFFGESTTAHLKSRGVLIGGQETDRVFHPYSNTLQIQNACSTMLRYLGAGKDEDTIGNIVKKVKPAYLVLCFGLNGVEKFASGEMGKKLFVSSYTALIDEIKKNSPDTKIILGSIYPVAVGCTDFRADAKTVNSYLREINRWTMEIARENGLKYCDAASAVTDEDGFLSSAYDTGDHVHITADGYKRVLLYLRTHAYTD